MIKISEFTPSLSSNDRLTNTASCNVIVNNNTVKDTAVDTSTSIENVDNYPSIIENTNTPSQPPQPSQQQSQSPQLPVTQPLYTTVSERENNQHELYHHLAVAFSNILKTNNSKMLANIIDNSGKVILDGNDLIVAISLALGVDKRTIKINYEDPEAGCLAKVNPIKKITNIKVNGCDFNLMYNRQYNTLTDEFNISLTKIMC